VPLCNFADVTLRPEVEHHGAVQIFSRRNHADARDIKNFQKLVIRNFYTSTRDNAHPLRARWVGALCAISKTDLTVCSAAGRMKLLGWSLTMAMTALFSHGLDQSAAMPDRSLIRLLH
jgi:hypothetical protein